MGLELNTIITIDGPAGTGKSTIARLVAKQLNWLFLDTGAMYRAIAYAMLEKNIAPDDLDSIKKLLSDFNLSVKGNRYFLEQTDISEKIRQPSVSAFTSTISALPLIRNYLVPLQRQLIKGKNTVAEGRDLGTVVFPEAQVKIFLIANPAERAKRRIKQQGLDPNDPNIYSKTLEAINTRDQKDSSRTHSPLRKADNAIIIDTTDLSINQVVDKILETL